MYIKIAEKKDINNLIYITESARETLGYPDDYRPKFNKYLHELFNKNNILDNRITFIYYLNDAPAGYISFSCLENFTVEVNNLFVLSNIQRKGVGTILLNECEKFAKKIGTRIIKIGSEHNSIEFYLKKNYIKTEEFLISAVFSDIKYPYVIKYL